MMKDASEKKLLKSLGLRLLQLREDTGFSQETMSFRIGMDRTMYASAERGERNLSLAMLQKIAWGFGLTLSKLLVGVGGEPPQIEDSWAERIAHKTSATALRIAERRDLPSKREVPLAANQLLAQMRRTEAARGEARGYRKGEQRAFLHCIRALMEANLGDACVVMHLLHIPESEQAKYQKLLSEKAFPTA